MNPKLQTPLKKHIPKSKTKDDNFSFEFLVYPDELSPEKKDSSGILETPKSSEQRPSVRKKKLNREILDTSEENVIKNIEEEIGRQLDEKAAVSNLSPMNVKNILKHIITNEQVLALVRHSVNDEPFKPEDLPFEPKLTRAKVKELLQNQPSIHQSTPIKSTESKQSEIHILIDEEFPEDEEDEEYVPGEEDSEDDQDVINTSSDLESQPGTPLATNEVNELNESISSVTQTTWSEDGVFKIPTTPSQSLVPEVEETPAVALRTRSKLCLSDTPLESIEQAFIPPDITTDMYDIDCDDDDWKNFLTEFTKPLEVMNTAVGEDDEETDPEYNLLADLDLIALDKEELRADKGVKVTRRELSDLVAELFDYDELLTPDAFNGPMIDPKSPVVNENPMYIEELFETEVEETRIEEVPILAPKEPSTIVIELGYDDSVLFKPSQILLLEQQIQQHIQLMAQAFIQSINHPLYSEDAKVYKIMIEQIDSKVSIKSESIFNVINLKPTINFMRLWESKFLSNDNEMLKLKAFYDKEIKRYNTLRKHNKIHQCRFPKTILDAVSESEIFIYPFLLPQKAFRPIDPTAKTNYLPSEQELIAIGLEQFTPMVEKDKLYDQRKGIIKNVCVLIARYMMPVKDSTNLHHHVKHAKLKKGNPINHWFEFKVSPPTLHYVVPSSQLACVPMKLQKPDILREPWKSHINPPKPAPPVENEPIFEFPANAKVLIPSLKQLRQFIQPEPPKRKKRVTKIVQRSSPRLREIKPRPIDKSPKTTKSIIHSGSKSFSIELLPQSAFTPAEINKIIRESNNNTLNMLPSMPSLQPQVKLDRKSLNQPLVETNGVKKLKLGDKTSKNCVSLSQSLELREEIVEESIPEVNQCSGKRKFACISPPQSHTNIFYPDLHTEIDLEDVKPSIITPGRCLSTAKLKKSKQQDEVLEIETEITKKNLESTIGSIENVDEVDKGSTSFELRLSPDRTIENCEDLRSSESENDWIIETESENESSCDEETKAKEVEECCGVVWSRDEDKILLKTYQNECDSENAFEIIGKLLPKKTIKQIIDRFETLINLLAQQED